MKRGGYRLSDLLNAGRLGLPTFKSFSARVVGRAGATPRLSRTATLTAAVALGAVISVGAGYLHRQRLAAEEAAQRAELANVDLQDQLARLRDQFAAANQALNLAQSRMQALNDEATRQLAESEQSETSKADRIAQMSRALEQAQRELHLTEAQRVTLMARLSKAEGDLVEGQARRQQAQAGIEQWQQKVQQLTIDRDRAAAERDQLRARVGKLEQQLSLRQTHQPAAPVAAAMPSPATPAVAALPQPAPAAPVIAAAPQPAAAVAAAAPHAAPAAAVAPGRLAQFERVLASAGVDVARLFARYGMRTGEGGPFVPAPRGATVPPELSADKLAALARLMQVLPVSAPLQNYELGSPFGFRHDPLNGHSALHTGIDLRAPYMTPVYATAPGVVTFSGYRDDYGKVVEIDHGNGISTRYAHLHRQTVSVGQRVAAHTQIGFLGSTGRATGPHVHYEVLVNGEPQDPAKFFGLAHLVTVAQH